MISTLVRGSMAQKSTHISGEHKEGAFVYFGGLEIQISAKEKEILKYLKPNEMLLRLLTGQMDSWVSQKIQKSKTCSSQERSMNSFQHIKTNMGPPSRVEVSKSCYNNKK